MDLGIKGKKVLVVGASKNIGAAITKGFAAEGCIVTGVARDEKLLETLVQLIGGTRKGHGFIAADLLEEDVPTKVAQDLLKLYGPFDIVVHNVGGALGYKDPLGKIYDWERVWKFNVGISIEMNRVLIPAMIKKRWGRVIHISSISAEVGEPLSNKYGGALPYAAAKAYLNAYVKGLGKELAKENIIVSALMPGIVLSKEKYWDKLREKDPKMVEEFVNRHYSIGRFGKPEEIAPFVVFMASKQVSFAAGSIVPLDGGRM